MNVVELAPAILRAFTRQLETEGLDLPDRKYVSPGVIPVWDGEQFVVNLQQVEQGQPGGASQGTYSPVASVLQAQFAISLVRKVPGLANDGLLGTMIPDEEDLGDAGAATMSDAQALTDAAIAIHQAHTLTEPGEGFAINACTTMGPDGGMAACRLLLTFSLS